MGFRVIEGVEKPERIAVRALFLKVINGEICVLLGLHREHQKWMIPGGGIEQEDAQGFTQVEQALKRELKEELGLRIFDFFNSYYPIQEMTTPPGQCLECYWRNKGSLRLDRCLIFHISYDAELPFNQAYLPENSELGAVRWVPIWQRDIEVFCHIEGTSQIPKCSLYLRK